MLMRMFYSRFRVFVVAPFAALGERAVIPLKGIVKSNNGPRLRRSRRDVGKPLYNDETIVDHRSTDFRRAPHVACSTPVFFALLIPDPLLLIWRSAVLAGRFGFCRFFAALAAVRTASTCGERSASRSRIPRVLSEFVFSRFVLPAPITAASVFPYSVQIKSPALGDKSRGSSRLLVTTSFFMRIVREDGCATINSASRRFKAAMFDGSKRLGHSGGHAYAHGAHL